MVPPEKWKTKGKGEFCFVWVKREHELFVGGGEHQGRSCSNKGRG